LWRFGKGEREFEPKGIGVMATSNFVGATGGGKGREGNFVLLAVFQHLCSRLLDRLVELSWTDRFHTAYASQARPQEEIQHGGKGYEPETNKEERQPPKPPSNFRTTTLKGILTVVWTTVVVVVVVPTRRRRASR
jgi:hypothetical protein